MPRPVAIGRSRAAFSLRLKRIRIDAGLTQKDLERLSGIPKSRISRYENGHLLPSFQGLRKLATSLGIPESSLLGEIEEPYTVFIAALRRLGIEFGTAEEAEEVARQVADVVQRGGLGDAKAATLRR
jgi:transcriptional regulator with XRE-family HTH domain